MAAYWALCCRCAISGIVKWRQANGGGSPWLPEGEARRRNTAMYTHDWNKWKMERSWLCVKKQRVVHDLTSLWGKVVNKKALQSLQSRKRCCRSWLFEKENKDRHNINSENIQTVGQILVLKDTRLYPVPPASLQTSLHCPVLASPGCCLDAHVYIIVTSSLHIHHFVLNQTWNKNWFPNLSSSFVLYCKPLNLISGYHHTINYIHLKIDFSKGLFSPFTFQRDQRAWF